ncbi:hypothetical protein [Streptomonospora sp. PA3]|uniref:hypothetical protein n=1 Tax=Streptomonospora sp. PA3 TaxID=2607326 RepID=UPI0037434CD5
MRRKRPLCCRGVGADVGDIDLSYVAWTTPGAPHQMLVTYLAEPGSKSVEALRILGSMAASYQGAGSGDVHTRPSTRSGNETREWRRATPGTPVGGSNRRAARSRARHAGELPEELEFLGFGLMGGGWRRRR